MITLNLFTMVISYSTFRFDCRGLGQSEGVSRYTPHYDYLQDLQSTVSYLRTQVTCPIDHMDIDL